MTVAQFFENGQLFTLVLRVTEERLLEEEGEGGEGGRGVEKKEQKQDGERGKRERRYKGARSVEIVCRPIPITG